MKEFDDLVADLLKDSGGIVDETNIENVLLLLGRRWRKKDANFAVYHDIGVLRNEERLYGRKPATQSA